MTLEYELSHRHVERATLERGRDARFVHESHDMYNGECRSCGMRAHWEGAEAMCTCRHVHLSREYEKTRRRHRRSRANNPSAPRPSARRNKTQTTERKEP